MKMNKKIMIGLAVLAAFMMLTVPLIAIQDDSQATATQNVIVDNRHGSVMIAPAILSDNSEEPISIPTYGSVERVDNVITFTISEAYYHKNGADVPADGFWMGVAFSSPGSTLKYTWDKTGTTKPATAGTDADESNVIYKDSTWYSGVAFYVDPTAAGTLNTYNQYYVTLQVDSNEVYQYTIVVVVEKYIVSTIDAFEAVCTTGGNIVLERDITFTNTLYVSKSIVLDLNGKILDGNGYWLYEDASSNCTITVNDTGKDEHVGHIDSTNKVWVPGHVGNSTDVIIKGGILLNIHLTNPDAGSESGFILNGGTYTGFYGTTERAGIYQQDGFLQLSGMNVTYNNNILYGIVYSKGESLTISKSTISDNCACDSVIRIISEGSMTSGTISNNIVSGTGTNPYASVIRIDKEGLDSPFTFTILGGTIEDNAGVYRGGAIYVKDGCKLEIGTTGNGEINISGNNAVGDDSTSGRGGAIAVDTGSTLTIGKSEGDNNKILISNNRCNALGAAVYIESGAFFDFYSGKIQYNQSQMNGGGVNNAGTFRMFGGLIDNCYAILQNGGGVYTSGVFQMSGGAITNCIAGGNELDPSFDGFYGNGGAVWAQGTFTMSGGTISGCIANGTNDIYGNDGSVGGPGGDAVYLRTGTFTITGGTIENPLESPTGVSVQMRINGASNTTLSYEGGRLDLSKVSVWIRGWKTETGTLTLNVDVPSIEALDIKKVTADNQGSKTTSYIPITLETTSGQVTLNNSTNLNSSFTIPAEVGLLIPDDVMLTLESDSELIVSDSPSAVVGEAGIIGSGTVVVEDGAILSLGNDSNDTWLVSIDVKVYAGGTMNTFVGPYGSGYAITPTAATTEGYVLAHHNASSGNYWVKADGMTYTIAMDATVNESAAPGTILSNGNAATILSGSTVKIANLTVPVKAVLTVSSGATLDATAGLILNGQLVVGGNVIGGGVIDFSSDDIAKGSKVITILNGGNVTATLTSGADENLVLKSAVAGEGGITVTKGSIYVDGVLKTGDFVVESGQTVHISGTLDDGATLTILGTGTVVVPENATLTFDEGSALVNETGTISVAASGSAVIYEKGSYINNVEVEVTKKTDSSGTHVSITITLVSEDGNKLVISSDVANEVFSGQTYGDALKGITATPAKKFITFDGWYILANNEKVSMAQTVLDYDHVLTACFTDERASPVNPDDSGSSETHYIPLPDNGDQIDIALPAAFVMLILSIFVLGFVVVKKRK